MAGQTDSASAEPPHKPSFPQQPGLPDPVPLRITTFLSLAESQARRWAGGDPDRCEDLRQEGLLALHRALTRLDDPTEIKDPWAWACTMIDQGVRAEMRKITRRQDRRQDYEDGGLPPSFHPHVPIAPDEDPFEEELINQFLQDLEDEVGSAEAWVAEQLVRPGEEIAVSLLRELEDVETGPDGTLPPYATRITARQIRDALGWSKVQWYEVLGDIRSFARRWLPVHGVKVPAA